MGGTCSTHSRDDKSSDYSSLLGRLKYSLEVTEELILEKCVRTWKGFFWLKIGSIGELLWTCRWDFQFHKMRVITGKKWGFRRVARILESRDNKIWSWVPPGLGPKNDCAGEGQQKFSRPINWENKRDFSFSRSIDSFLFSFIYKFKDFIALNRQVEQL
jgi:hypothetical protein